MNTNRASDSAKLMSAAGALSTSCTSPLASRYCHGNTASQFAIRMKVNRVTASGRTNGAIRMPIEDSIWLRIWVVIASQNSCTPLGTPVEVTFARRMKANTITITAAIAVDSNVSVLTVMPNHSAVSCLPTSSARMVSVIAGCPPFHGPGGGAAAERLQHRQRRRQHQQQLKQSKSEQHTQASRAHQERDGQRDHRQHREAAHRVDRHLPFERVGLRGDP